MHANVEYAPLSQSPQSPSTIVSNSAEDVQSPVQALPLSIQDYSSLLQASGTLQDNGATGYRDYVASLYATSTASLKQLYQSSRENITVICLSILSLYFFLLYISSPDGSFHYHHALTMCQDIEHSTANAAAISSIAHEGLTLSSPHSSTSTPTPPSTLHPLLISSSLLTSKPTSHPHINKKVYIGNEAIPHVLQVAEASVKPGGQIRQYLTLSPPPQSFFILSLPCMYLYVYIVRHVHESATEIFYVKQGILTVWLDSPITDSTLSAHFNGTRIHTSSQSSYQYTLLTGDSFIIPARHYHRMSNEHMEELILFYVTVHTP